MTAWPPQDLAPITTKFAEWSAWYSGDRKELESVYSVAVNPVGAVARVRKAWQRFWNGNVADPTTPATIKVHVPLAADVARGLADMLWSEPPAITSDDDATSVALQGFLDDGLITKMAAGTEVAGAIGGMFMRAMWDTTSPEKAKHRVFCGKVDYDLAVPTFAYEELLAVTFWRTVYVEGASVWRHLETHELDAQGDGIIRHQLWKGDAADLGDLVPLTDLTVTAGLAAMLEPTLGDGFSTHTPGLAVVHFPCVTPNALWRKHAVGAHLGQALIAGAEDLLDRLDHTYSSLLEEVDLAKAMITIPENMLKTNTAGAGVSVDRERTIWATINVPPTDTGAQLGPQMFQPDIRVEKFLAVMQQLTEDILRHCGFSASSFGEDEDGGAQTATEVDSKKSRSGLTRARMLRTFQPGTLQLVQKMLAIGGALDILSGVDPEAVTVVFPPATQASPLMLAQTVQAMATAIAASIETKVRTLHPDWDDQAVDDEVAKIREENGIGAVEDPSTFTGNTITTSTPPEIPAAPTIEGATP